MAPLRPRKPVADYRFEDLRADARRKLRLRVVLWKTGPRSLDLEFEVTSVSNSISKIAKESEDIPIQYAPLRTVGGQPEISFLTAQQGKPPCFARGCLPCCIQQHQPRTPSRKRKANTRLVSRTRCVPPGLQQASS
jgi:hypothetical protein